MAKAKPDYEVNNEFNQMAVQIVEKYPEKFNSIEVAKVCCVNITNKERKEKGAGERIWKIVAVKQPVVMHCAYGWYVVLFADDWNEKSEKHKLLLVTEVLHGLPMDEDNEGKLNPCDTKGYHAIFKTFGLDCHDDPDVPHILDEDIDWKV